MSDETENKGYKKPAAGEEEWHVPLNENFDRIDADIHEVEQRLENGSGEGSTARFEEFIHDPTNVHVEGSIVEDHGSGSLDHWDGNTDPFEVISGDTIAGEYSVQLDHPGGEESYGYQMGTDTVTTRRGEVYSCFVRFDEIDERNQSGLTVCGEWDEDGIVQGYLARLEEDGDLQILKYADGEFVESSDSASIDLETGVRYRIEIELGWDDTTARAFDADDDELASTRWDGETELTSGGAGYGGRWANGSDGETVTFDHITRKSLDAAPARVSGSTASSGGSGDIDTSGVESWDVLLRQVDDDSYEAVDSTGETVVDTANGPNALNEATEVCPEGGTLVVKGYYPFDDGESWRIRKDLRAIGHRATLETLHSDDSFFIEILYKDSNSYDVDDLTQGNSTSSSRPVLELNDDIDGDISKNDIVMIGSDEEYPEHVGGPDNQNKGEGHMVAAGPNDEDDGDIWDDLNDNEISLMEVLEFDYDTSYDIEIEHYIPVSVHFEGFDCYGPGIWEEVGGIRARGVAECVFRDLFFEDIGYEQLRLTATYDVLVDDSVFTRGALNSEGYGVVPKGGVAHTYIQNCRFHMMRHGIAHSGSGYPGYNRRSTTIENCIFTYNRSTALDMHGEDLCHRVINCTFHLGQDEAIKYGKDTIVEGCYFNMDRGEDDAMYSGGQWENRDLVVTGCYFRGADRAIRADRDGSDFNSINVTGNHFESCEKMIRIRCMCRNLNITGNTSENGTSDQIRFYSRSWWDDYDYEERKLGVDSGIIANNSFIGLDSDAAIRVDDDGLGDSDYPIARDINITGNNIKDSETFIRFDGPSRGFFVNGNQAKNCDYFCEVTDSDATQEDHVIVHNVFRDVDEILDGLSSSDNEIVDGGGWEV